MVKGGCRGQAADHDGQPWGVLQDSDGDNVAVVDDGGAVVAEFVYDPYGAVIGQRMYGVGDVHPVGHARLLGATPGHRLWSLGCGAWVGARVLRSGERVVTIVGSAAVVGRVVARVEPAGAVWRGALVRCERSGHDWGPGLLSPANIPDTFLARS